jgi:hypothetical protein
MSNNTIQIKRTTGTNPPTAIADGELAHAQNGNKLYIGVGGSNTAVQVGGDLSGFATTADTYDQATLNGFLNAKAASGHSHDYSSSFAALAHDHATVYYTKTVTDSTFAPIASPTFTGQVQVSGTTPVSLPNPTVGSNTNEAATTSWVQTKVAAVAAGAPNLDNAALTGVPTSPTAAVATNTTQVATTAFVAAAVSALLGGAPPAALDTLNELAAAFGDDADAVSGLISAVALKMDADGSTIDGGTYT